MLFETRRYSLSSENSGRYEIDASSSNSPNCGSSRPSISQYIMEQDPNVNEYLQLQRLRTHSSGRFGDLDSSGDSEQNYYNFIINNI